MTHRGTIISIFRDEEDERASLPLIAGIMRINVGGSLAKLENLKKLGVEPALAIISRKLYPEVMPELVGILRQDFPDIRFLIISSSADPFPPLQKLVTDKIRNLTINPLSPNEPALPKNFITTLEKLATGRALEISDYLDAPIQRCAVRSSSQKEDLINAITEIVPGDSPELEDLRQRAALLADEMLENAMYGAPRGEDGRKLYRKGEERTISHQERIVFSFGFDGRTLALEVADSWGNLSPDLVMEHLARNQEAVLSDDSGGRGLFIIWRFLDQFHVNISPGRQTVVGGRLALSSCLDIEAPKGFYISTQS